MSKRWRTLLFTALIYWVVGLLSVAAWVVFPVGVRQLVVKDAERVPAVVGSMPAKLITMVDQFRNVRDPKLRYQELLFMGEEESRFDNRWRVPENLVPGCQSRVYVHCELDANGTVQFFADSDSQLTRGLAMFLVKGLSGSTVEDISAVDPSFAIESGLAQSLTTTRSGGLVNMLLSMQLRASQLKPQQ